MQEGLPQKDNSNMSRRDFLKKLGGAAAAGIVGAGLFKTFEFAAHEDAESKKHEKLAEVIITNKGKCHIDTYTDSSGVSIDDVERCMITLKIGDKEIELKVLKKTYETFNEGDKVPLKYDDRNMRITEILDKRFLGSYLQSRK